MLKTAFPIFMGIKNKNANIDTYRIEISVPLSLYLIIDNLLYSKIKMVFYHVSNINHMKNLLIKTSIKFSPNL